MHKTFGAEVGPKAGPKWPCTNHWVCKFGPGWAQLGPGCPTRPGSNCPILGPTGAHVGEWVHPSWSWAQIHLDPFATTSRQVGPNGDTTLGTSPNAKYIDTKKRGKYKWNRCFEDFVWAGQMDFNLGRSCSQTVQLQAKEMLEPSHKRAHLGRKLGQNGPQVWPMLRTCWIEAVLCRSWADLPNVQMTTVPFTLWRSAYHPLLKVPRLGTCGAGRLLDWWKLCETQITSPQFLPSEKILAWL